LGDREHILIVEDKRSMAEMLVKTLDGEGFSAESAGTAEKGLERVMEGGVSLLLTDMKLPGMDGMELLRAVKEKRPMLPVIMMTAFGSIELAVKAVKAGAYDFLTKPFDTSQMVQMINRALKERKLETENLVLKDEFAGELGLPEIIGDSGAITQTMELVKKVAPTKATVLLAGESGTGKEVFARALHHLSERKDGPFVPVNCAAIPRDLMESELFGHEKGAFTGAESRRIGKFELADGGTIFLDEVGELDPALQAKLLRVLEDETVERVGGHSPIKLDVRVVAATNKDLEKSVEDGSFRGDLFYRLNVFPVVIPPLRERRGDIGSLARHFVDVFCREMKKPVLQLGDDALLALASMRWKGNVRELQNCIERAVIVAEGLTINTSHLNLGETGPSPEEGGADVPAVEGESLHEVSERASRAAEERAIRAALNSADGNKTKAAQALGVSYKTLLTKIKDFNIV